MWFKQAQLFQFSKPIPTSAAQLSAQLEAAEFSACLPTLPSSCGWVAPIDETEEGALLAYKADKFYMICLQLEEKILPAAVVRQAAIARIEELEALHDKKLPHSEKKQIKEEMQHTMLPRAFSKITKIYAYIDIKNRWLIVNTATTKKLELFINFLKRTLGQDFYLPKLKRLAPTMTQWLLQPSSCPKKLDIKSTGVLQDARQSHRVIRCQNQNLYSKSIQSLLQDGCEAVQLSLIWEDKINFVLSQDFSLRSLNFDSELVGSTKDIDDASKKQILHADLILMAEALTPLFSELVDLFSESIAVAA